MKCGAVAPCDVSSLLGVWESRVRKHRQRQKKELERKERSALPTWDNWPQSPLFTIAESPHVWSDERQVSLMPMSQLTRSEHDFEPTDNLESSRHAVARLNDRAVRRQGHNVPKSSLSDLCASCRRVWQVLRRPSIGSSPIDRSEDKQEGILLMTRDWT